MALTDKQRLARADSCWDSLAKQGALPEELRPIRDHIVQALPVKSYPCVCTRGSVVTFQWIGGLLPVYVLATVVFDAGQVFWWIDGKTGRTAEGDSLPGFIQALAPLFRPTGLKKS